jgi:membrane protein DedA with SNARE-associated domain
VQDFIVNLFQGALDNLNYWWIIVFMAIESSFIPFPSEIVMIPAAYKAYQHPDEMSFLMIIICGTIGALIGALVNYVLSYFLGRPIVYGFANSRFGHICLIDEAKVKKAEEYFTKRGNISTLIGRMIPAIRQLISIPAGLAKMPLGNFILYTSLGAGIWNSILVGIGYICGKSVEEKVLINTISHYSHIIGIAAIIIVLAIIIFLVYQGLKPTKKVNSED